jgi:phosphatidylglycerophosphatase A
MGAGLAVDGPKQNSPGRSRGCFASNRSLALTAAVLAAAMLAAALSGLLLTALSGLLGLLARLLLPAATLLLTAVLAALLLLATALATLIGIVHDHSCEVKPPTHDNGWSQGMFRFAKRL